VVGVADTVVVSASCFTITVVGLAALVDAV
jgi:hypothetical protein